MRKFIAIIFIILCFCSCGKNIDNETRAQEAAPINWTQEISSDFVLPVYSEAKNTIFYFDNGIWSYEIDTKNKTMLSEDSLVSKLYLHQNSLYFLSDFNEIKRINLDGNKEETIWQAAEHEDLMLLEQIHDFNVYNDNVYIYDSGISLLTYSLQNNKTERFLTDVSSYDFLNNEVFFSQNAARDFTIYKKSIVDSGEISQIVRGNGEQKNSEESEEMYDKICIIDNVIYYTKRLPAQIYSLNPQGEDVLIADFSHEKDVLIIYMSEHKGRLYYAPDGEVLGGNLYCYVPETNRKHLLFSNPDFIPAYGFSIVNDYLFFRSEQGGKWKLEKIDIS